MINDQSDKNYDGILELKEVRLPIDTPILDNPHERLINFRRFEERLYIENPVYFGP